MPDSVRSRTEGTISSICSVPPLVCLRAVPALILQKNAELPHTVIIFICTFDYFDKQLPIYTFEERCVQMPGLRIGDGAEKIFVNPDSRRDGLDKDLNAFLDYLQGKRPPARSRRKSMTQLSKQETTRNGRLNI